MKNIHKIEDELYMISNTENVNENCWIITDGRLVQVSYLLSNEVAKGNKVILTTNNLLIKEGVQAIDDEFLKWFVKNPNCEEVKVIKHLVWQEYKIIIPKEEQEKLEEARDAYNASQERSYNEEEVLHILDTLWDKLDIWYNEGYPTEFNLKDWFNKCELKKK